MEDKITDYSDGKQVPDYPIESELAYHCVKPVHQIRDYDTILQAVELLETFPGHRNEADWNSWLFRKDAFLSKFNGEK